MEDEVRREIALFRYALVRQAADGELSPAERGRLVRQLAGPTTSVRTGIGCGWAARRLTGGSAPTGRAGSTCWCLLCGHASR